MIFNAHITRLRALEVDGKEKSSGCRKIFIPTFDPMSVLLSF
jgi:hypothetical protein